MTDTEKRYSQTEKDALSDHWAKNRLSIYYIDESVLVENRPLVKFIRNYIRDLSSLFSTSSLLRISMTSFPLKLLFMHRLPNAKRKMASDRFVKLIEADIKSFSEEQENVNTNNKTLYDLKLFKEFLTSEEEGRELQEIPAAEL